MPAASAPSTLACGVVEVAGQDYRRLDRSEAALLMQQCEAFMGILFRVASVHAWPPPTPRACPHLSVVHKQQAVGWQPQVVHHRCKALGGRLPQTLERYPVGGMGGKRETSMSRKAASLGSPMEQGPLHASQPAAGLQANSAGSHPQRAVAGHKGPVQVARQPQLVLYQPPPAAARQAEAGSRGCRARCISVLQSPTHVSVPGRLLRPSSHSVSSCRSEQALASPTAAPWPHQVG